MLFLYYFPAFGNDLCTMSLTSSLNPSGLWLKLGLKSNSRKSRPTGNPFKMKLWKFINEFTRWIINLQSFISNRFTVGLDFLELDFTPGFNQRPDRLRLEVRLLVQRLLPKTANTPVFYGICRNNNTFSLFFSFWQRSLYNEPDLKSQPVWPLIETGLEVQFKKIKANWKSIRDEALNVYSASSGGFINESESLKDTGYWGQFDLFIQGREKVQNCAKAPKTCALVKNIPQIKNNRRGQVKFSVMKSGTHVHAHSGPTNCRLRAHLGLKVNYFF